MGSPGEWWREIYTYIKKEEFGQPGYEVLILSATDAQS